MFYCNNILKKGTPPQKEGFLLGIAQTTTPPSPKFGQFSPLFLSKTTVCEYDGIKYNEYNDGWNYGNYDDNNDKMTKKNWTLKYYDFWLNVN